MSVADHVPAGLDPDNAVCLRHAADARTLTGLTWSHRQADGRWCSTEIPFRGYGDGRGEWTILIEDPITVLPALRCPACKAKVWLEGGKPRAAK